MDLTKKLLYILLAIVITALIILVLFGKNGLIKREQENYNETHVEEREDDSNRVIINN